MAQADDEQNRVLEQHHATPFERALFREHLRTCPNRVSVSYIVGWLEAFREHGSIAAAADAAVLAQAREGHALESANPGPVPAGALRARKPDFTKD